MLFPNEDPPGWYVGDVLQTTQALAEKQVWINFSAEGSEPLEDDDVKINVESLGKESYMSEWALFIPKTFSVEAHVAHQEEVCPTPDRHAQAMEAA